MVDFQERRVVFATEGKGADCIEKSVEYLEQKQVCIDISPAFIVGCRKHLPQAAITFNKFYVVKEVNKAMDQLRKLERKGNKLLKGYKYILLKKSFLLDYKTRKICC